MPEIQMQAWLTHYRDLPADTWIGRKGLRRRTEDLNRVEEAKEEGDSLPWPALPTCYRGRLPLEHEAWSC